MMSKRYIKPVIEIIDVEVLDMLSTSGLLIHDEEGNEQLSNQQVSDDIWGSF